MNEPDKSSLRIAWLLVGSILLSFAFGMAMFLPAEHRAQKIQEIRQKYQIKQHRAPPLSPTAPTAHDGRVT